VADPGCLSRILIFMNQNYGFGIRDPEKTYSGSRIHGSKIHRIPDQDPQHWSKIYGFVILELKKT
jgi:hypothetical protein